MESFDDRLTITTPEGVDLELMLAGVGSRFIAVSVDLVIQLVIIGAFFILALAFGDFGVVAASIGTLLVLFGYHIFFEALTGRTPGKRWSGLRVLRSGGRPIGFRASTIRNLLRLIDYTLLIGVWSIILTPRNQRLGDLAGDTIVVRELHSPVPPAVPAAPAAAAYAAWDTSSVTTEELTAVRQFLQRRDQIDTQPRNELAHTMAERLRPKVVGAPAELRGERFLEALAAAKASRG
jgi:uncharacterized RDD family membrane protein YckC